MKSHKTFSEAAEFRIRFFLLLRSALTRASEREVCYVGFVFRPVESNLFLTTSCSLADTSRLAQTWRCLRQFVETRESHSLGQFLGSFSIGLSFSHRQLEEKLLERVLHSLIPPDPCATSPSIYAPVARLERPAISNNKGL